MRKFIRWDEEFTTEETDEFLKSLVSAHIQQIGNVATRERVAASFASDVLYDLCDLDPEYAANRPLDSYHIRQVSAFFSKRADIDRGYDREATAVQSFKEAEARCMVTNALFRTYAAGKFIFPPAVEEVLYTAMRKIAYILGDVPELPDLKLRFGPGATTQVKKQDASARSKLGAQLACSEDLLEDLKNVLHEVPSWFDNSSIEPREGLLDSDLAAQVTVEVVDGRLGFVPKNAKTHRGICVEPMLNSMYQLAIGEHIAERLKRSGVDIRDQTKNQRLAREGSITGALATLDLTSASDTIATELVASLVPLDWFLLMSRARTGHVTWDGERIKLEKFSSMGNGFTFPLETLIFYSLAWASCPEHLRKNVNVYGDDIIIPIEGDGLLRTVLHLCGFLVNGEKSFSTGPFRESCGKDYLSGIDIRPAYLKSKLTGQTAFVLHNYYVRTKQPDLAALVLEVISEPLRKWGPDGYGDGHLLGDWTPDPVRGRGYGGYTFETYSFKGRKNFKAQPGDFVYPSYCVYVSTSVSGLPGLSTSPEFWARIPKPRPPIYTDVSTRTKFYRRDMGGGRNCGTPLGLYTKGALANTLPGTKGYKLIKIYTLAG